MFISDNSGKCQLLKHVIIKHFCLKKDCRLSCKHIQYVQCVVCYMSIKATINV